MMGLSKAVILLMGCAVEANLFQFTSKQTQLYLSGGNIAPLVTQKTFKQELTGQV